MSMLKLYEFLNKCYEFKQIEKVKTEANIKT